MTTDPHVVIESPDIRVGRSRIARSGEDSHITYTCSICGEATPLSFNDVDYRIQAALHAALPGCSIDDYAAQRFTSALPIAPGQRALEARCAHCGTRFRVLATGGELDRDGALEYDIQCILTCVPEPATARPSRIVRGIALLIAMAFLVGAGLVVRNGLQAEQRRATLLASGVTTRATIVQQSRRYRGVPTISVQYSTQDGELNFARIDVPILSGWHLNDATVAVRYDPKDTTNITLASTAGRHAWMQLIGSVLLALPGLMIIRAWYRTRGSR